MRITPSEKIIRLGRGHGMAVWLAGLALSLVAGSVLGQTITSVSPKTAAQGTTGLTVSFTLSSSGMPLPPADAPVESVMIGTLHGTSVTHASQAVVTAVFDIPSGEPAGVKAVSVTFSPPPPNEPLVFTLAGGVP